MTPVQTLRMGFLESDDRLLLDFVHADHTESLLVTRRILRRIIQGVARILAQSSPVLGRVPASHQSEMLVWEHLSALQIGEGAEGDEDRDSPAERPAPPWQLLARLDIKTRPASFDLHFHGHRGAAVVMAASRPELHRLLAGLRRLARHAEWDLDTDIDWLVEADAPQMRPGSLAS